MESYHKIIYPWKFNPITNYDIQVKRQAEENLGDRAHFLIHDNGSQERGLFDHEERMMMMGRVLMAEETVDVLKSDKTDEEKWKIINELMDNPNFLRQQALDRRYADKYAQVVTTKELLECFQHAEKIIVGPDDKEYESILKSLERVGADTLDVKNKEERIPSVKNIKNVTEKNLMQLIQKHGENWLVESIPGRILDMVYQRVKEKLDKKRTLQEDKKRVLRKFFN